MLEGDGHHFVVEVGSDRGAEVLAAARPPPPPASDEPAAAAGRSARTAAQMGRELDVTDIRDLLYRNYEHPRWDEVADAA